MRVDGRQDHLSQMIEHRIGRALLAPEFINRRQSMVVGERIEGRTRQVVVNGIKRSSPKCPRVSFEVINAYAASSPRFHLNKLLIDPSSPSSTIRIAQMDGNRERLLRTRARTGLRHPVLERQPGHRQLRSTARFEENGRCIPKIKKLRECASV